MAWYFTGTYCGQKVQALVTDLNAFLNAGADAEIPVTDLDSFEREWVIKSEVEWDAVEVL
jgi:hypothetical protein